ncbi:MAG: lamin tail domain-containing protein [Patescibacteria group bacterium]|jgi:hypothetical protein
MKKFYLLSILIFIMPFKFAHATVANHIVIGEIQISGATGFSTDEFVELYNPLDNSVDLTGWQLIKRTASGAAYPLIDSFELSQIPAHGYFLIAHPTGYKGAINPDARYSTTNSISSDNSVELVNTQGIVDLVGWGKATHLENQVALNPGNSKSLERKALISSTQDTMKDGGADMFRGNGEDTDNNGNDLVIRENPEPQNTASDLEFINAAAPVTPITQPVNTNSNVNTNTNSVSNQSQSIIIGPKTLIITELFPNPKGDDSKEEFIEIFNFGEEAIDLKNWKVEDTSKSSFTFPVLVLSPGKYYAVKRPESGIALNNTGGDTVNLVSPDGETVSSVKYKEAAAEARAYAYINKEWIWTNKPTPGADNVFTDPNNPPVAIIKEVETEIKVRQEIQFSAAESSDPDGDDLDFVWDFSDGKTDQGSKVKHVFAKPGKFIVTLIAKDSKGKVSQSKITIKVSDYQKSKDLSISALMPNPVEGEEEWVEIQNSGSKPVNLEAWQLKSKTKITKLSGMINAKTILRLTEEDLNFTLRNDGATIEFLDPDGKIISSVTYPKAKKGEKFIKDSSGRYISDLSQELGGLVEPKNPNSTGKVEGENVEKAVATTQPINLSDQEKANNSLPIWSWLVVGGGLGGGWLIWEIIRKKH